MYFEAVKLAEKGSYQVVFEALKEEKTNDQLAALNKLIDLSIPHLNKWKRCKFSKEEAKDFIKVQLGFVEPVSLMHVALMIKSTALPMTQQEKKEMGESLRKIKLPKTCKYASKFEVLELITALEAFAASEDRETGKIAWPDVFVDETLSKKINKKEK